MNDIVSGVIYGLLAEFIVVIVLAVMTKIKNSSILKFIAGSKIFKHGIEYVYKNQSYAINDIMKDIENSSKVKLFCMRGRSFIQSDAALSDMIERRDLTIQFLVLNPNSKFVLKRANELNKKNYKQELETNINDLKNQTIGKDNVIKKMHNQPPIFRILLLDNRVYFSFFKENKLGSQIPVFRAKLNSEIYRGLNRYFDYIWDTSNDM